MVIAKKVILKILIDEIVILNHFNNIDGYLEVKHVKNANDKLIYIIIRRKHNTCKKEYLYKFLFSNSLIIKYNLINNINENSF